MCPHHLEPAMRGVLHEAVEHPLVAALGAADAAIDVLQVLDE
jgi:hypothetical protein